MLTRNERNSQWYIKWLVLLCAFCNFALMEGVRFSFGILYVELLDAFEAGKGATAWIGSVQVGLTNLGGFIAGSMVRRFGTVVTIVTGTLLSCVGLFASSFANSIYVMYLTYGVLPGFGLVMMNLGSMVAVSQCFDQKQSLAMGIYQAGGSIGGFIFNPSLQSLIESYGWQGALLIMSGILLHGTMFALVIRVLGKHDIAKGVEFEENKMENSKQAMERDAEQKLFISKDRFLIIRDSFGSVTLMIQSPQSHEVHCEEKRHITINTNKGNDVHDSFSKVRQEERQNLVSEKLITDKLREEINVSENRTGTKTGQKGKLEKFLTVLHQIVPYQVLSHRPTFIFVFSALVRAFGFFVPFILLPDLAVDKGISVEQAAWLSAGMGISGAVSRVLLGWIGDFPSVDRMYLYIFCLIGSGTFTVVCPSFYLYGLLMVYACAFGCLMAGECSLTPVICSDVAGRDKLAETFGMLQTLCGIGALCGTPLSGWLFEATGGYNVSFILAGSLITLSGILLLPVKCTRKDNKV